MIHLISNTSVSGQAQATNADFLLDRVAIEPISRRTAKLRDSSQRKLARMATQRSGKFQAPSPPTKASPERPGPSADKRARGFKGSLAFRIRKQHNKRAHVASRIKHLIKEHGMAINAGQLLVRS